MQRHPWNINHTPSLVLCDFIFPHHALPGLNVLMCSLKCLFFTGCPSHPFIKDELNSSEMHKKSGIKSCSLLNLFLSVV